MNQLKIACCQGLLCDCESLIRLYQARFIVWPPFVRHCQIWSSQSVPRLITGCSLIAHRQNVLKCNDEDSFIGQNEGHRCRECCTVEWQRKIDPFYPFVLLPRSHLHKRVCVPSIKQTSEKEPAKKKRQKGRNSVLIWTAASINSHFSCKICTRCTFHSLFCSSATGVFLSLWWQLSFWKLGKQTCVMWMV